MNKVDSKQEFQVENFLSNGVFMYIFLALFHNKRMLVVCTTFSHDFYLCLVVSKTWDEKECLNVY